MLRPLFYRHSTAIVLLVTVFLLAGCAGKGVAPNFYTLTPVSNDGVSSKYSTVGIAPVTLPGWLDQSRMTWNDGSVNLQTLGSERWAGPLSKVINQTQLRNFNRLYPDADVSSGPWERSRWPERVVRVSFMSLDRKSDRLGAEIAIQVLDSQRNVLNHSFKIYQQPLADRGGPEQFAMALSELLGQVNQDVVLLINNP